MGWGKALGDMAKGSSGSQGHSAGIMPGEHDWEKGAWGKKPSGVLGAIGTLAGAGINAMRNRRASRHGTSSSKPRRVAGKR